MRSRILNSQVVLKKVHTTLKVAYIEKEREGESLLSFSVTNSADINQIIQSPFEIVKVFLVIKKQLLEMFSFFFLDNKSWRHWAPQSSQQQK